LGIDIASSSSFRRLGEDNVYRNRHKVKRLEEGESNKNVLDFGRFFFGLEEELARSDSVGPGSGGWECHDV
jgi:hypothetical protein